jgi:hypothetical protein
LVSAFAPDTTPFTFKYTAASAVQVWLAVVVIGKLASNVTLDAPPVATLIPPPPILSAPLPEPEKTYAGKGVPPLLSIVMEAAETEELITTDG